MIIIIRALYMKIRRKKKNNNKNKTKHYKRL